MTGRAPLVVLSKNRRAPHGHLDIGRLALEATGHIICIAGIVMTLAFGSLLVSLTAALNQIGYLLIVGVLLDCFVTTKLIIPSVMALLPCNFWPRRPELVERRARVPPPRVTLPPLPVAACQ